MKIALVQINPVIGDFAKNCEKIITWSGKAAAEGCALAIFPEMAISGYPPQDLLERKSFVQAQNRAIDDLITKLPDIHVLFGCFEEREEKKGKKLYNSAFIAKNGKIVFKSHKQLLPTYDVFDETRYFTSGEKSNSYTLDGKRFGITICEDIWHQEIGEYSVEPLQQLSDSSKKEGEITAIINISASPFQRNKEKQKHRLFANICTRYKLPLIYVNQVGGQDSLLFDGRSVVMDQNGQITTKGGAFTEGMVVVNSDNWKGELKGEILDDEIGAVYQGLVMGVRDYSHKCGFKSGVRAYPVELILHLPQP